MDKLSIAPCGVICDICLGVLRSKDKCVGCNHEGSKLHHCSVCSIKLCNSKKGNSQLLCSECIKYPCKRLRDLNKRYLIKYGEDLRKNLEDCKEKGIDEFIKEQEKKWICKKCGNIICVHKAVCIFCGSVNPYFPRSNK